MIVLIRRKGHCKKSHDMVLKHVEGVSWNGHTPVPDITPSLVVRWGSTANIPQHWKKNLLNDASEVRTCSDKAATRSLLNRYGYVPEVYTQDNVRFPCVVRPASHFKGKDFHVCNTYPELNAALDKCGPGAYISEYIDREAEYRVMVINNRIAFVCQKTPPENKEGPWNHVQGNPFNNVRWGDWDMEMADYCIWSCYTAGVGWAAVDIMKSTDGEWYVCELNSGPAMTSNYRAQCVAKALQWEATAGEEMDIPDFSSWKNVIHPGVRNAD